MKIEIENLLNEFLPKKAWRIVQESKTCFGNNYLKIAFAASDFDIHNVKGQKPQIVSLSLDLEDLNLEPQIYGGCGGQRIHRRPDLSKDNEKYLAMVGIRIPFRRPEANKEAVLKAVKNFAKNWIKALKENQSDLMYQDLVDYNELLTTQKL